MFEGKYVVYLNIFHVPSWGLKFVQKFRFIKFITFIIGVTFMKYSLESLMGQWTQNITNQPCTDMTQSLTDKKIEL